MMRSGDAAGLSGGTVPNRWILAKAVAILLTVALAAAGRSAFAGNDTLQVMTVPEQVDSASLALTGGWYDFNLKRNEAAEFGLEYRSDLKLFIVKPFLGASATTDGSVYGYAGILTDIVLWDRLVLTPSFAAGAWHKGSSAKDLGHWVEFRSQIELTAHLGGGLRAGVYFNHVSNAGLGDINPGVEVIGLTFVVPLRSIFQ